MVRFLGGRRRRAPEQLPSHRKTSSRRGVFPSRAADVAEPRDWSSSRGSCETEAAGATELRRRIEARRSGDAEATDDRRRIREGVVL